VSAKWSDGIGRLRHCLSYLLLLLLVVVEPPSYKVSIKHIHSTTSVISRIRKSQAI
jgi:hypothetical protein